RDKPPSTLKIDSTKSVEPPQASAALKSLQSAHFLSDPFKISYPDSITAPDAELNANAPADKKFKYNKEFLLQFQNVVKEKPSLDWDQRVKETVGDTSSQDSGRAMSSRGGSSRQGSRAGPTPSHHGPRAPMGAFGGSTMDPARMGAMGNMGSFMGGGFAGRTGSNIIPSSPRTGSRRGAGGRQDSKHNKPNRREDEHKNSNMPLTANMEIKPIQVSATGWKPRSVGAAAQSGPQPGGEGYLPPDVVQRKVKAALNKMTPENFDRISDQILAIVAQSKDEDDGRTLRQVIQLTFEKATDEAHWAGLYARFCKRMLDSMSPEIKDTTILDKQGHVVSGGSLFRKYLLTRCQEEFERGWKNKLPKKPDGQTEEAVLMSDEYYIAAAAKRRGLGLVKFIGELYKLGMLTERIMHQCVHKLVDFEGIPEEAEVESLCNLLKTIGYSLDASDRGHTLMDVYFERVEMMMNIDGLPSRLRFMLMDIVDLRKSGWASKDAEKGPKTIQEIRAEAARAAQAQEMERARQQSHRGGRPAAGRGDARGYGGFNQPPPDNSRQVGSEDLRRLRANPRGQSSSPASFGPSTMFSRTSSGRGSMGPGGNLLRAADSRTNSRAGSSAGKAEKEEPSRSRNAFDALAALNDHENPVGSPPSNPTSPAMAKAKPDQAE
ncbi:Eukaryotic translation initiation factor 4 gamma, partial [Ascosphaera pollenicola]